jgi:predicted double-glycine peptidase
MMANQNNNYPMKEWHFEHMQKTILKYVSGLTENEKQSSWKVKQHRRYGARNSCGTTKRQLFRIGRGDCCWFNSSSN